jgi:ABC-type sulfate/molybdate transport systems ATPase subunit
VLDPVALLLDAPLGSSDVALKEELLATFATIFAERQLPVVCVTHDPLEAARIARCIIVLERGQIAQQGTAIELAHARATPFIEAFARALRSRCLTGARPMRRRPYAQSRRASSACLTNCRLTSP